MKKQIIQIILLLVLYPGSVIHADFYKYEDSKGTLHITNEMDKVPAKYRNQIKVIKEVAPEESGSMIETTSIKSSKKKEPQEKEVARREVKKTGSKPLLPALSMSKAYLTALFGIISLITVFVVYRLLKKKRWIMAIIMLLIAMTVVYLVNNYSKESLKKYMELKEATEEIQQLIGEREKIMKDLKEELPELN